MLRHYEQHEGGVKIYTKKVLSYLLTLGHDNTYVLFYKNPDLIGTYKEYDNVEEVCMRCPSDIVWDQVVVPWLAWKNRVDVIFNPKFTVPFFTKRKKVFVLHGSEWFVIPEAFLWYDRIYTKIMVPLYCKHATRFITVSRTVMKDAIRFSNVSPDKITPIYNGYESDIFNVIQDGKCLNEIKVKYGLPDNYILWVGQLYPPKNFGNILRALALIKDEIPHKLLVVGEERWRSSVDIQLIDELQLGSHVQFTGWVEHADLPAIYNQAKLFVFPSLYEGFGIPLLEAMACGCPVLTSKTGSPPEVVDDAALLVDPSNPNEIAEGIIRLINNEGARDALIQSGLERAASFSWEKTAREVLSVLVKN